MAIAQDPAAVTAWDAQGKPVQPSDATAPAPTAWDADGKPVPHASTSAPAPAPDLTGKPGEGTYPMWNGAGHKLPIPYSAVPKAQQLGYTFDTNKITGRDLTPEEAYRKDFTQDPSRPATGFSETARRGFVGLGKGIAQSLNPTPQNPQEAAAAATGGQAGAIVERAGEGLVGGSAGQLTQAGEHIENFNSKPWGQSDPGEASLAVGHGLAGLIPGAGPMAADAGEQIGEHLSRGDVGGAIAAPLPLAATVAAGELAPKVVEGVKTIPNAARAVSDDAASEVAGQTQAPSARQAKSHAAVIAEGNPGGDTSYLPQQIADATGSKLRQIAADNPEIAKVIRTGKPEDAFAAHQKILDLAKKEIDDRHNAVLDTVADTPVDMKPVQDAVKPSKYELEGMDEADAQNLEDLQDRAGKIQTLKGLNEFRKQLSTEDTTLKNPMAQGKSALYPQAIRSLYKAARDAYYDQLEQASGQSFKAGKQLEGNIIQEQRGASNAGPRLTTAQAKETAPQGIRATAADVIDTGGKLPVAGWAANKLRGTKLGQIQQHLQRFYSDLPDATPAPAPPKPQFSVQSRQLANPQRQLPADVPANAEVGPPGQPQAPPAPRQAPPGFSVSPDGSARPGAPPIAMPATITPEPDAVRQLPAEASPSGPGDFRAGQRARAGGTVIPPSGVTQPLPPKISAPQLGAGEGNPEFVTPEPSPPPNAAGASDNVRGPLPANPQPAPPGRTTVTPEGVAIKSDTRSPSRQLPAPKSAPSPATHEWSKSDWQAANPKRDLAKATAHARALGYKVVD